MSPSATAKVRQGTAVIGNKKLTLVRLALLSELASSLHSSFTSVLVKVLIAHDFTTHELVLKVRAVVSHISPLGPCTERHVTRTG